MYEDILNEAILSMDKTRASLLSAMYQNVKDVTDYGKQNIVFNEPVYDKEIITALGMSDYGLVMYGFNIDGNTIPIEEFNTDTLIEISKILIEKKYSVL